MGGQNTYNSPPKETRRHELGKKPEYKEIIEGHWQLSLGNIEDCTPQAPERQTWLELGALWVAFYWGSFRYWNGVGVRSLNCFR